MAWEASNDRQRNEVIESEEKAIASIKWSQKSLPLWKFVQEYTLPQIVQIVDGYYSQEEDSSLSSGQILKIHCMKMVEKVSGCDQDGGDIHVPLNTPQKVIQRPEKYDHIYETVNDLANAKPLPKFVEVIRGYYDPTGKGAKSGQDLTIESGERLEVIRTAEQPLRQRITKEKHLKFKNVKGDEFELPLNCSPGFKELLQLEPCFFAEAVNKNTLPFYASFVNKTEFIGRKENQSFSKFGVIKFKEVYKEDLIIASCGHFSVRVIFTIPKEIDVTVRVACGALINDAEYAGMCQGYNNYKKIDVLAVKRHELDIYRSSGEVKGYEYHMKTQNGGEFVGLHYEQDECDDFEKMGDGDHYENLGDDMVRQQDESLAVPYKASDLTFSRGKYDHSNNHSSDEEESSSGSYEIQQETVRNSCSDTQVKLIKITSFDSPTDKVNETGDDVQATQSIINANVADDTQEREQQQNIASSIKEMHSFGKQRELANLINTGKSHGQKPESLQTSAFEQLSDATKSNGKSEQPREQEIPVDLTKLDTKGVCDCLIKLNLGHLREIFVENQVNGSLLISLDSDDYKDLGLRSFETKKLLKFANGWRPDNT